MYMALKLFISPFIQDMLLNLQPMRFVTSCTFLLKICDDDKSFAIQGTSFMFKTDLCHITLEGFYLDISVLN